ncbi:unnamed protein product [Debaryomyces tyrocola]|nr:unnamed protein product [Debaryomyces tyrocola]
MDCCCDSSNNIYITFVHHRYSKQLGTDIIGEPEAFLLGAIFGSIIPIIFAWTSSARIHWIFPLLGSAIFALDAYIILEFTNYLSLSFWEYLASVFTDNVLFKSIVASFSPVLGLPLFNKLSLPKFPVAWGATIKPSYNFDPCL